jgi:ABC-type polysaccharide/polyol phosphate transport system ATPase subunit
MSVAPAEPASAAYTLGTVPSEQTDPPGRPALAAQGVDKRFKIPEERSHTLKERALHPLRRTRNEELHVLKDISFSVAPGEFFGIVGRNGSGKSTLLKCLAGIYGVDQGKIWCNGRMSTFIELGVGFNPDLAAYENVALNGIMLGLSPREARARYERVIEFAELEEFQDLKLKNYSSGMHVRLAFSVAIQVDADILLIDEVLAVGDASFQQKCFDVFNRMREEGRTIVFVTHDMGAVTRFCHRAMLLERGEVVSIGDPRDVADRYLEFAFGRKVGYQDPEVGSARMGDGAARVSDVWLGEDPSENRGVAPQSEALTLKARVDFHEEVLDPAVSVTLLNEHRQPVVVATTSEDLETTGGFKPGEQALFAFSFHNMLAPGRYYTSLTITRRGEGVDVIDRYTGGLSFVVSGLAASGGMVEIPVETEVTRLGAIPQVQPAGEPL